MLTKNHCSDFNQANKAFYSTMTESSKKEYPKNMPTNKKISLRNLRISLKYRPDVMKIIIKMKECIRRKNDMIYKLKRRLKKLDKRNISEDVSVTVPSGNQTQSYKASNSNENLVTKDSASQTKSDDSKKDEHSITIKDMEQNGWNLNEGETEKSIAEQVTEAAQNAMQESGMVYVESAGMYYDYKTGYYYNSELGLYYHSDTGCYYYYSEDNKTFQFHSYPDRSVVEANAALAAHEKRKARKHKAERKKEDQLENLTKTLSQDHQEDARNEPKRKRKKINKTLPGVTKPLVKDKIIENEKGTDAKVTETSHIFVDEQNIDQKVIKKPNSEKEMEDGECSDTASESEHCDEESSDASTSTLSDDESVSKHHPPCMRVIVRESTRLRVGSLFLVTKDGGTVGREGETHAILIKDHNVSRNHLDIKYDMIRRLYTVTDLGSKNGTILNGSRMSESQIASEPMDVVHGSVLQLGETKLLCHVHPGADTCGHCEPGLLLETEEKEKKVAYTRTCSVQKQHQLELARLKNKYAPKLLEIEATAYNDRAQARREKVGSSHHSEKTQSNDLDTFIAPENKGFKLLEKMGWSKGEGLGKDNQGGVEPVPLVSNDGKSGLGSTEDAPIPYNASNPTNTLGPATLRLAARTKMLQPPAKAFQQTLDNDSD